MQVIKAQPVVYRDCEFRSTIEARWAVCWDTLGVMWEYEPVSYDLGLKHHWDSEDQDELRKALYEAEDEDERDEIRRQAWWKRHEKRLYVPDFWLNDYEHWVEIKGKPPTVEERSKARSVWLQKGEPVHILWGNIPDPHAKTWGECSDVYGTDMGIIAMLVVEYGMKAVERAFTTARLARFRKEGQP